MRPSEDGPGNPDAIPPLHGPRNEAWWKRPLRKLGISFWVFGLINNVLYVVILSAALDLVPASTPKGIILFCNITPSMIAKVLWPYISQGRIRYARRVVSCCVLSFFGMVVVSLFDSVSMRLLGIGFASFSSGLGELTFLQLSTTYRPSLVGGMAVGSFASGTGAAGLVGASLWWFLRGLGVRVGVGLSSVLPFVLPAIYFGLLPDPTTIATTVPDDEYDNESMAESPTVSYAPVPTMEVSADEDNSATAAEDEAQHKVALTKSEKLCLVKPLLIRFMLPLFCVYLFEYTINQGIAPTLLYPVPTADTHPVLGRIIHSVRDYYPLWQLVYQTTVFLSRSSISLGLAPLPVRFISLPAVVQAAILVTLTLESARGLFGSDTVGRNIPLVFLLISIEGVCGGLAYVNVFYHVNQSAPPTRAAGSDEAEHAKQVQEFRIGAIGLADSSGIVLASILAIPTEVALCDAQVMRGRTLCRSL